LVWILPGFKARRALKKLIKACGKDGTDPVEVITKVAIERGWTVTKREPNQVELKKPRTEIEQARYDLAKSRGG
jgi:hypothetical protein